MYTIAGACAKCGAPFYLPQIWHGITPPAPTPSCQCWNVPRARTVTTTNIVWPEGA